MFPKSFLMSFVVVVSYKKYLKIGHIIAARLGIP